MLPINGHKVCVILSYIALIIVREMVNEVIAVDFRRCVQIPHHEVAVILPPHQGTGSDNIRPACTPIISLVIRTRLSGRVFIIISMTAIVNS